MTRVLVTGASGFVGGFVCQRLVAEGFACRAALRSPAATFAAAQEWVTVGDIGPATDWQAAVRGCDAVIHLAGRAHLPRAKGAAALAAFRHVNVEGTRALVLASAEAGVRRLVLVSSIGVNGTRTADRPFSEVDAPAPVEDYAVSKLEAEAAARELAARHGLELAIVRPTLVYGPGNPGNMLRLLRLVRARIPLPLASIVNQRSLVGVENLAGLLVCAAMAPAASGELFLASDGQDVSTPELVRILGAGMGVPVRLWPVPQRLARLAAATLGARRQFESLWGNLQVDSSKARDRLGWRPHVTVEEGLKRAAQWFGRTERGP